MKSAARSVSWTVGVHEDYLIFFVEARAKVRGETAPCFVELPLFWEVVGIETHVRGIEFA